MLEGSNLYVGIYVRNGLCIYMYVLFVFFEDLLLFIMYRGVVKLNLIEFFCLME